jgi:hypothetical protein
VKNTFDASLLNSVLNSSIGEMDKIIRVMSSGKGSKTVVQLGFIMTMTDVPTFLHRVNYHKIFWAFT